MALFSFDPKDGREHRFSFVSLTIRPTTSYVEDRKLVRFATVEFGKKKVKKP
jgi:hypothetical protein